MSTAADVIAMARSQLGYTERPVNQTKYWTELDPALQGSYWCAVFVSWVFKHAGCPLPPMDREYGYMNTNSAMAYAKANGLWSQSGHYAPGDILCYGNGEHTGIVVADDGTTITAIEGNAIPDGASGSQSNGGGVYLRHRPHGAFINGVLQGSRMLNTPAPPTPKSEEQTMADLVLTNPLTKANASATTGLNSQWKYAVMTYDLVKQLAAKSGVEVDESAIARAVVASMAAPIKAAVAAAVAAGGSADAIADAVVARLASALVT